MMTIPKITTTENNVAFTIPVPKNHDIRSLLISRLGLHIATLTPPPSEDADGDFEIPFKDESPWLEPALGYTYEILAIDRIGMQYIANSFVATTANKRPDFIPDSFGPVQQTISPGDAVTFQGTIKNIGDGASTHPFHISQNMYNNSVAITFSVNGRVVSWGGDNSDVPFVPSVPSVPLVPVTAGGGPNNNHTWLATEGNHVLKAHVDDINRIPGERDKFNNLRSQTLTVGDFPGKLQMSSEVAGALRINDADFADWVHFNAWGEDAAPSRKPNANLISAVTQTGEGYVAVNPGCAIPISYGAEGGQPSAQNSHAGLWGNCLGNGFTFTVPADTTERELKIIVGVTNGGRGEFSASLSDDSVPGFVDTTWNANRSFDWSPVPGEVAVAYTLRYRAANPGQTLTVAWKLIGDPNRFNSQIRLQAATLK